MHDQTTTSTFIADEERLTWRKSTHSEALGNCVEAAPLLRDGIAVRDSKTPHAPVLRIAPEAWTSLMTDIRRTR